MVKVIPGQSLLSSSATLCNSKRRERVGLPRDCSPGAVLAFPHSAGHCISTSPMILTDSGSSRSPTPNSCYVANCAARRVTGREWEFLPVDLVSEPLLLAKPELLPGRLRMGRRGKQEANGGQLHWQSLGAPLMVRVAKWDGVGEAASLDLKAGRGPGSQVTSSLLTLPHPSQKEPTAQGQR